MKRCADCNWVIKTVDEEAAEDVGYECGLVMPFWVPLPVGDYGRWVKENDGANCAAFEQRAAQPEIAWYKEGVTVEEMLDHLTKKP